MRATRLGGDSDGFTAPSAARTEVLGADQERKLLERLVECKAKLTKALSSIPAATRPGGEETPSIARYIASINAGNGREQARLGAIFHQYTELRDKLALANMRLVAHVAKRFRGRGIAYSDLLQEGFCGLLEAIDRFDLTHETKLATYATWWIRQAIQRAVAEGAYPVRLSPRHLRQLAQNQEEIDRAEHVRGGSITFSDHVGVTGETLQRIHAATRPALSLNATFDHNDEFTLLQTMSDPEADNTDLVDTEETIAKLLDSLRPRERRVLALRFGLGDQPKLSLSEVGKVLEVSKERVRQIQDRALEKLRELAVETNLAAALDFED